MLHLVQRCATTAHLICNICLAVIAYYVARTACVKHDVVCFADIDCSVTHGKNKFQKSCGHNFFLPDAALDQVASSTAHLDLKYKLVRSWAKIVCRAARLPVKLTHTDISISLV